MNINSKEIKFSVLVPVYNVEKYIEECIISVLNQTYKNFELILVDDGSTDKSGGICEKYAKLYDCIKLFHKPNAGLIHTRRFAIEKACGDYYIFLDSDDSLVLDALQVIYETICRTKGDCIVYGMNRVFEGNCFSVITEEEERIITDKLELYRKCFFSSSYNPLCRKAIKSTMFSGIDYSTYYNVRNSEDLLQSIELYKNCNCVVFITNALYNYTLNPNSITQNVDYKNCSFDFLLVREQTLKFLKEENLFSKQDYRDYRTYVIELILCEILKICNTNMPVRQRRWLLDKIRQSRIYLEFLNTSDYNKKSLKLKGFLFDLFRYKWNVLFTTFLPLLFNLRRKIKGV